MKQPFYEQPNFMSGVRTLGAQLLAPFTYPGGMFLENVAYNRGFTLKKYGPKHYEMFSDRLDNALAHEIALGEIDDQPVVTLKR